MNPREGKLADLRNSKIPNCFYLPAKDGLPESYASLLTQCPVHQTFFRTDRIAAKLVARLSSIGMMALQHTMSENFGVQFAFDHEYLCTQPGRYSLLQLLS